MHVKRDAHINYKKLEMSTFSVQQYSNGIPPIKLYKNWNMIGNSEYKLVRGRRRILTCKKK